MKFDANGMAPVNCRSLRQGDRGSNMTTGPATGSRNRSSDGGTRVRCCNVGLRMGILLRAAIHSSLAYSGVGCECSKGGAVRCKWPCAQAF